MWKGLDIHPPTDPNPGQLMAPGMTGRFDPVRYEGMIIDELAKGEYVIIDMQYLSAAGRADLDAVIARHPEWAGKVRLH